MFNSFSIASHLWPICRRPTATVDSFAASPTMTLARSWSRQSFGWQVVVGSRLMLMEIDSRFCIACCAGLASSRCKAIALLRHLSKVEDRRCCSWCFVGAGVLWEFLVTTGSDWGSPEHPCLSVFVQARKVSCLCWWTHWSQRCRSPSTASPCCRCGRGWSDTVADSKVDCYLCWRTKRLPKRWMSVCNQRNENKLVTKSGNVASREEKCNSTSFHFHFN